MNLIISGPPGSGKGTQARALSEIHGLSVFSTGEILRSFIESGGEKSLEVKSLIESGQLVDDDIICNVVSECLAKVDSGFLLDGFPRNMKQAGFLTDVLDRSVKKIDAVIELVVPDDVTQSRILGRVLCSVCKRVFNASGSSNLDLVCRYCGSKSFNRRGDDLSLAVISRRIESYRMERDALRLYYSNILILIDGCGLVSDVTREIARSLEVFT